MLATSPKPSHNQDIEDSSEASDFAQQGDQSHHHGESVLPALA